MADSEQIEISLMALRDAMKVANIWSSKAPSQQQLSSTLPFSTDTLRFDQWLQFVFIPKLSVCIAKEGPLPLGAQIHPMATHVWPQPDAALERVINILFRLDVLLRK